MTCKKGGGDALNIVTFEVDLWRGMVISWLMLLATLNLLDS